MTNFKITDNAIKLIETLLKEYKEIIIYQGSGCCDGSIPICMDANDFKIGSNDVLLFKNNLIKFYVHNTQVEYYQYLSLTLDVKDGNGSEYSIEYGTNQHFVLISSKN